MQNANITRCQLRDQMKEKCPLDFIVDPKAKYEVISDTPVTRAVRDPDAVQLRPQIARLTNLRVGMYATFCVALDF